MKYVTQNQIRDCVRRIVINGQRGKCRIEKDFYFTYVTLNCRNMCSKCAQGRSLLLKSSLSTTYFRCLKAYRLHEVCSQIGNGRSLGKATEIEHVLKGFTEDLQGGDRAMAHSTKQSNHVKEPWD